MNHHDRDRSRPEHLSDILNTLADSAAETHAGRTPEALESRHGQQDGGQFAPLDVTDTGIDVAADVHDGQIRAQLRQLRCPSRCASADPGTVRQVGEAALPSDHSIANVRPGGDRGQDQVGVRGGGQILQ